MLPGIDGARSIIERKLKKHEDTNEIEKFLDKIKSACSNMSSIVSKTTVLAKADSTEKTVFSPEIVSIPHLVSLAINHVNNNKNIEIIVD